MASEAPIGDLPARVVPMRLIVCSLQRTGTLSMRSALWQLGFHDCYHMHDLMQSPDTEAPQWVRAMEAKFAGRGAAFARADWDRLLGHCQAVCDVPASLFAVELAEAYPDAKVVILSRDPEAWYQSMLHSIYTFTRPASPLAVLKLVYCALLDGGSANMKRFTQCMGRWASPYDLVAEKDKAIALYQERYDEFRDRIPADRWVEMNIKDGWRPLCEHLGVPVPTVKDGATGELVEAPFPRMNDRDEFLRTANKIRANALSRANDSLFRKIGKLAVAGAAGYAVFLAWRTRFGGRV